MNRIGNQLLCYTFFAILLSSSIGEASRSHRRCFMIQKVKRLAKKHRLPTKAMRKLEKLYCKKMQHVRKWGFKTAIYGNDACSGEPLAVFGRNTSCRLLSNRGTKAWSVRYRGKCQNIPDVSLQQACYHFRDRGKVQIYKSDSCSGSMVATIGRYSDCRKFNNKSSSAWAVRHRGKCYNIKDVTPLRVCYRYRGGRIKVYKNDSCSNNLVAMIGPNSNCERFAKRGSSAWAIRYRGKCHDFSDVNLYSACLRFQGRDVKVYKNDSCSGSLVAIIGPNSECEKFPKGGSNAWAVWHNGKCHNITDTSIKKVCYQYRTPLRAP